LKRNKEDFIYDIKIDLHGMTSMQAFHKVLQTIETAHKNGDRKLLFITGIGDSARGTGIIRQELPVYVDHPTVRDYVLGYKYENGKYLVRLRKNKTIE